MLLEKLSGFAEGKYDITVSAAQIAEEYEGKRTESWQTIEELNITQRIVSTSQSFPSTQTHVPLTDPSNPRTTGKMVQQQRLTSGSSSQLGRTTSTSTTSSRVPPPASGSFQKKAPPPPPSSSSSFKAKSPVPPSSPPAPAAPPPYSPSTNGTAAAAAAAAKRAPPPPPPLKSKPKPAVQYVVALYDFAAQADGDLDFKVGDRIEVVERTDSAEDWWTGRLEGRQGVFPGEFLLHLLNYRDGVSHDVCGTGNYVQDA